MTGREAQYQRVLRAMGKAQVAWLGAIRNLGLGYEKLPADPSEDDWYSLFQRLSTDLYRTAKYLNRARLVIREYGVSAAEYEEPYEMEFSKDALSDGEAPTTNE